MDNTVENTAMQMIDTTEMEMEAETERVAERILPMPTEKCRHQFRRPHHL